MISAVYRHSKTQFHSVSFQNYGPLRFAPGMNRVGSPLSLLSKPA